MFNLSKFIGSDQESDNNEVQPSKSQNTFKRAPLSPVHKRGHESQDELDEREESMKSWMNENEDELDERRESMKSWMNENQDELDERRESMKSWMNEENQYVSGVQGERYLLTFFLHIL